MAASTITAASPLTKLDCAFVRPLANRMPAGILEPSRLDRAVPTAHHHASVVLPESRNPRTRAEAATASMFVSAHYGSMANAASHFFDGSREGARTTNAGTSPGRLARQAMRIPYQVQGMPAPRETSRRQAGVAPAAHDVPKRRHPMQSSGAQPAGTGDDAPRRLDPMQSGEPARQHPMPSGDGAQPAAKNTSPTKWHRSPRRGG